MTAESIAARRARLARAAAVAAGRAAGALDREGGGEPAPGDLYVLREAAAFAVEWLVIERDAGDRERLFVVPADTNPLLGGDDWALTGDAAIGPLSLRCGFGLWLGAGRLAAAPRVGSVAPESLAPAARWCAAVRGTGAAGAAGADPEVEDWLEEVIAPARAAVTAILEAPAARVDEGPRPANAPAALGTRLAVGWPRWLAVAASLLLVVALGLGGALNRQAGVAHRLRLERDALRRELLRPAPARPANAPDAPEAANAPEAASAGDDDVLLDPPLVTLQAGALRGGSDKVQLDPAPRRLVLLAIEPLPGGSFPEYRLEIRDHRTGGVIWSGGGLHLDPASRLVMLGIRQRLLPAGRYEIRLDGLRAGRGDPAGSYSLEIESGGAAGSAAASAPAPPPPSP